MKETKLRLKRFSKNLRHAAKHPEDPEAIHDLRVSIRRVVQAFKTFGELLDPAPVKKLRRRLHKVMDLCAAVRNCDVALTLLDQSGYHYGRIGIAAEKDARRGRLKNCIAALSGAQQTPCCSGPPFSSKRARLEAGPEPGSQSVARPPRARGRIFRFGQRPRSLPMRATRQLHQFRLQAKRFRYTLELFERFYGSEMANGAEILKELQDRLGAINDCATTIVILGRDRRAVTAMGKLLRQRKAVLQTLCAKPVRSSKAGLVETLARAARAAAPREASQPQSSSRLSFFIR